jgi:hypothetical protein
VPKSSGDYASVSSVSSYAHSVVSSNFTLSSGTTDGSSAPSSIFDHNKPRDEPKTNAFSNQLKKLYRDISHLETKLLADSGEPQDENRIVIKGVPSAGADEAEKARWKSLIDDHKRLSEMMLNLLEISLASGVPASLRNIPEKYNIIIRLWTNCFYRLLENLRRSSLASPIAYEYLQEFIYYAYTFYSALIERNTFLDYRAGWLEALGDLARYRIVIASMVPTAPQITSSLTTAAVNGGLRTSPVGTTISSGAMSTSSSEKHPARLCSPPPSVGVIAARLMELEPDKDRWRRVAREWYAKVVAEFPGRGKLHHHLGLLSRDAEGEELRAVYHFVKSMIATHPFETARESVLPLWSPAAQARRSAPDARAPDLFVFLHGMLFTNIQLDDFSPTLARLLERLSIEEPEAQEWIMMAAVNIGALLEYGRPQGVLRRADVLGDRNPAAAAAATKVKLARKAQTDEKMEVDGDERRRSSDMEAQGPSADATASQEAPFAFKMAQELTFSMLAHALRSTRDGPNSYVTILLTFLQTVLRKPEGLASLERAIPWTDLAAFLSQGPRASPSRAQAEKLSQSSILLEDWAIRGMAWHGRLFERGFWDGNDDQLMEMEMLEARKSPAEAMDGDGMWEDENENEKPKPSRATLAWRRALWAGVKIANKVSGFRWDEKKSWSIDGALAEKARRWEEEARQAREEEERRKMGRRWVDGEGDQMMDEEDENVDNMSESGSEDDENDPEEIKALKARRRYLRSLLLPPTSSAVPRRRPARPPHAGRNSAVRPLLQLVSGYTVLVLDTNIVLSSLAMVTSLVESRRWTVVVPLPAIMELDGLASNPTALGEAAKAALEFVVSHVRSHSDTLKVQTSRGNYLSSLSVRAEQVDFDDPDSWERSMDDLILKSAIWQDDHWVDRSALLKVEQSSERLKGAAKVVLLSLDRNLRLKARARHLDAASERDLGTLLATTT